jgi:hypothetical protein
MRPTTAQVEAFKSMQYITPYLGQSDVKYTDVWNMRMGLRADRENKTQAHIKKRCIHCCHNESV